MLSDRLLEAYPYMKVHDGSAVLEAWTRAGEDAMELILGGRGDFGADRRFCRRNQDAGRGAG